MWAGVRARLALIGAALVAGLAACSPPAATPRPIVLPARTMAAAGEPAPVSQHLPVDASPVPSLADSPELEQYRAWIEEARMHYPYDEPLDTMWQVMMCESAGDAGIVAGGYYGLFQYAPDTWAGDWNPYRDAPILDARAQIFATAKAWAEGYRVWWSGCLP